MTYHVFPAPTTLRLFLYGTGRCVSSSLSFREVGRQRAAYLRQPCAATVVLRIQVVLIVQVQFVLTLLHGTRNGMRACPDAVQRRKINEDAQGESGSGTAGRRQVVL